ncbi:hypothetical protein [Ilyobacter polytropus]|uniref:Replication initiator protein A n=1 Tax=Ilyobacter polytropus (strain ATCC 51220 / DSM 2926 / LMG 16218 / CuHBu1) TaxID=572544 RepID=E3HDV0_ILYPC|nr:hypothetical protein [Ilyobacter polytropus]ADO84562.1 hypothetical protein Ilyop_2808 [Ilyobacter polytropus DSM 2926]
MNKKLKESYALFDSGGSPEDSTMRIIKKDIDEIETKIITYGQSDEKWEISSLDHISLPFFTRKKNKKVNLVYQFADFGIKMHCNITSQEKDAQQPSEFEESIFEYVVQRSFEAYKDELTSIEGNEEYAESTKEKLKKNIINNIEITFSIEDLLKHLGLLKSQSLYTKVEKALNNMKFTEYYFETENSKKAQQSNYIFETDTFKLINYQKLKNGRKTFYKIIPSSTLLQRALQNKNYLYFTESSRRDISKHSRAALRIFRYIGKKRFSKVQDTSSLEALAMVVPYEVETKVTKKTKAGEKEYYTCRRKEIKARIEEHMNLLVDLGYLKKYKTIYHGEKNYEFWYEFGEKMGIITTHTLKLENKKQVKSADEKKPGSKNSFIEESINRLQNEIDKSKRNIFISKAWNKRADNKIKKIAVEDGEEYAVHILKTAYKNLKQDVRTTLVQYINGIIKNIPKNEYYEKMIEKNLGTSEALEPLEPQSKTYKNEKNFSDEQGDPMTEILHGMYLKMKDEEQEALRKRARELYLMETNSKSFNGVHEKIFKNLEKNYIIRIIKGE